MKYIKFNKPVHAFQWRDVLTNTLDAKVYQFYDPEINGSSLCHTCDIEMIKHGSLKRKNGSLSTVCPGDYIVTESLHKQLIIPEDMFKRSYISEEQYRPLFSKDDIPY